MRFKQRDLFFKSDNDVFKPRNAIFVELTLLGGIHDVVVRLYTAKFEHQVADRANQHSKQGARHENAPSAVALKW